jgi:hypothetical protein
MSEETKKSGGLGITPTQVSAGALAAVTAAVLGSKLNVAGTITGAAVASVVSTLGGALYQRSFERTRESVRKVGNKAWVIKPSADGDAGEPEPEEADTAAEQPDDEAEPKPGRVVRWKAVAVVSAVVFLIGMLAVTGVELLRGAPLSGGDRGTTIGAITGKSTGGGPTSTVRQTPSSGPTTSEQPTAGASHTTTNTETTTTAPEATTTTTRPSPNPTPSHEPTSEVRPTGGASATPSRPQETASAQVTPSG